MENYYLKEFEYFNGENFVIFNIVNIDFDKNLIILAITNQGKNTIRDFDLIGDCDYNYRFIYGPDREEIYIKEFEEKEN